MQFMIKVAAVLAALTVGAAQAQYPQRPIQLIVPWGAGGGTDATARIIAALMEKDLKQPINVVNRTGGSGVVGHDAIAKAPADGYTIGLITVEITMMHHVGLTALKHSDYTPIGLVNADPAGIHVRVDSPYKNVKDLFAAIKAAGGIDADVARHFLAQRLDLVLGVGAHVSGAVIVAAGFARGALVGAEEHVVLVIAHGAVISRNGGQRNDYRGAGYLTAFLTIFSRAAAIGSMPSTSASSVR